MFGSNGTCRTAMTPDRGWTSTGRIPAKPGRYFCMCRVVFDPDIKGGKQGRADWLSSGVYEVCDDETRPIPRSSSRRASIWPSWSACVIALVRK